MATLLQIPRSGKLVMYLKTGKTNSAGNPIVTSITYANVKHDADSEDVYAVADALGSLMSREVNDISRIEINDLVGLDA